MNFNSLVSKKYIEREIEKEIFKFLKDRQIIVIRGPRQAGKSTLMKKIADYLTKKGEKVVYIDLEDETELLKLESNPKEYLQFYLRDQSHLFLFLDEIQYVKNAGKILKFFYDNFDKIKFLVSGSSTLDINTLSQSLVGRAIFFELYPFNFSEFLKAKNHRLYLEYCEKRFSFNFRQKTDSLFKDRLNQYLGEYLTFGGYPQIVLEENKEKKLILLKNLITTYIEKDLLKLYGIKYKDKVLILLKYLAYNIGNLLNYNDLCQVTNLSFQEVKEIISIFEQTYILKRLYPFSKNLITELKKNPKIYFFDLGLRNGILERFNFSPDEEGKIWENYGFLLLKEKKLNFWRTTAKAEVDFVLANEVIPVEIKKQAKITRSLLSFIKTYHPPFALIANESLSSLQKRNNTKIFFIPISLM